MKKNLTLLILLCWGTSVFGADFLHLNAGSITAFQSINLVTGQVVVASLTVTNSSPTNATLTVNGFQLLCTTNPITAVNGSQWNPTNSNAQAATNLFGAVTNSVNQNFGYSQSPAHFSAAISGSTISLTVSNGYSLNVSNDWQGWATFSATTNTGVSVPIGGSSVTNGSLADTNFVIATSNTLAQATVASINATNNAVRIGSQAVTNGLPDTSSVAAATNGLSGKLTYEEVVPVSVSGNDATGSTNSPFRTVSNAEYYAESLVPTASNLVTLDVKAGLYVENALVWSNSFLNLVLDPGAVIQFATNNPVVSANISNQFTAGAGTLGRVSGQANNIVENLGGAVELTNGAFLALATNLCFSSSCVGQFYGNVLSNNGTLLFLKSNLGTALRSWLTNSANQFAGNYYVTNGVTITNAGLVVAAPVANVTISGGALQAGPGNTNAVLCETGPTDSRVVFLNVTVQNTNANAQAINLFFDKMVGCSVYAPTGTACNALAGFSHADYCMFGGLVGIQNLWGGAVKASEIYATNFGIAYCGEWPGPGYSSGTEPGGLYAQTAVNQYSIPAVLGCYIYVSGSQGVGIYGGSPLTEDDPVTILGTTIQCATYTTDPVTNHVSVGIEGALIFNGGAIQANVPGDYLTNDYIAGVYFTSIGNALTNCSVIDHSSLLTITGSWLGNNFVGNDFALAVTNSTVAIVGSEISSATSGQKTNFIGGIASDQMTNGTYTFCSLANVPIPGTNFTTGSITNGLLTVSGTNGYVTATVTNGLALPGVTNGLSFSSQSPASNLTWQILSIGPYSVTNHTYINSTALGTITTSSGSGSL